MFRKRASRFLITVILALAVTSVGWGKARAGSHDVTPPPPPPPAADSGGSSPPTNVGVVRNGPVGAAVSFRVDGTDEQQFYTNDGKKLLGIAPDDLKNFASAPKGTSMELVADDGSIITLAYQGGGVFTGKYKGGDFGFSRPELAGQTQCSASALALAQARVSALQAQGRTQELAVARTVLAALQAACP